MTDEAQIRELQRAWFRATVARDTATIGDLMTDDAIFLTPGKPPFGRREFLEAFAGIPDHVAIRCNGEYEEITITGDVAWTRARLEISITNRHSGTENRLSGYALSILRRGSDGLWRLCRDANMLSPVSS